MLIRENQRLDLNDLRLTQQTVDVNAQAVCGQYGGPWYTGSRRYEHD
jgi:hypothetical protein